MSVEIMVNGEARTCPSGTNALDAIRDVFELTGAKRTCGIGGCGSCCVLRNGRPVETCTIDVDDLVGSEIVTVEGVGATDVGRRVQEAFIANDAAQCGYCTPGMVVAATAFVLGWDTEGTPPTPAEITAAIDPHLCRCGAYREIIAAIGSLWTTPVPGDPRPDARDKVTGAATFTVDVRRPGMLEGVIVRSTEPHAEVVSVDVEAAMQVPGVRAVTDLLESDRRVRYVGQPIAVVAGSTLDAARSGADVIAVRYRPLPAAVGMEAARRPGAPDVIGRRLVLTSNYEAGLAATTLPRRGNLRGPMGLLAKRRFTARRRIAAATGDPLLVSGVWRAASQTHAAPEPHSAVAAWSAAGSLTVFASTQSVTSCAEKLAKRLGMAASEVRVIADHVGGAFGAKQGLPEPVVAAALVSRAADAPVRIVFDPSEELAYGGYRPGAEIELSALGGADGSLIALEAKGYMDSGDSAGQTVAGLMRLSYPGPPMSLVDYDVVSNGAPARPFQAPGAPIALFALETAVDELAQRLGQDPIALRAGWTPRPGRRMLYEWAASHPLWESRGLQHPDAAMARGVGVAFGTWHYAYDPATRVEVRVEGSGLRVACGTQDLGTGVRTTMASAVADVFGVDTGHVDVQVGDSSFPHGPTSSASRTTPSVYPTARAAAERLRSRLIDALAAEHGMEGVRAVEGGVQTDGEFLPWFELWPRLVGRSAEAGRPSDSHFGVTPVAVEGVRFGWGVSDAAHLVEVEVTRSTGEVRIPRVAVAMYAGRIHTPVQARSQVHGALARGIGEVLWEARVMNPETGRVETDSYDRYRIMRAGEMPETEVVFFEEGFDHAAGGGVGIAELAISSVPAAVANAVAAATGARLKSMPMTPGVVLASLSR